MKSTPAYILRNCVLWVNNDVKAGQMSEVGIPAFKVKTESVRNAGMVRERQLAMGYETEDVKFKLTGFDPDTIVEVTGKPGSDKPFMVTGALVDEDGVTNNATLYLRGFMKSFAGGTWKPGDKAEAEFEFVWNYFKFQIGQRDLIEADDFDVSIDGVSQTGDIRSALLL